MEAAKHGRTARPSGLAQMKTLLRHTARRTLRDRRALLLRIVVLPGLFACYMMFQAFQAHEKSEAGWSQADAKNLADLHAPSSVLVGGVEGFAILDAVVERMRDSPLKRDRTTVTTSTSGSFDAFNATCRGAMDTVDVDRDHLCVWFPRNASSTPPEGNATEYMLGEYTLLLDGGALRDASAGDYAGSGFAAVQCLVNDAVVALHGTASYLTNPFNTTQRLSQHQPLPTYSARKVPGSEPWALSWLPSLFLMLALMLTGQLYMAPVIVEYTHDIVKAYKLMGVRHWAYQLHWGVIYGAQAVPTAIMLTAVFYAINWLKETNPVFPFLTATLFLVHYCLHVVMAAQWLSEEVARGFGFLYSIVFEATAALFLVADLPLGVWCLLTVVSPVWGLTKALAIYDSHEWAYGFGSRDGVTGSNYVSTGAFGILACQILGVAVQAAVMYFVSVYERKASTLGAGEDEDEDAGAAGSAAAFEAPPTDTGFSVTVSGLSKTFKGRRGTPHTRAVRSVDLSVCKGEIYGFLGHNGAGKSTTLSMMYTDVPADAGEILYQFETGEAAVGSGTNADVRARIGVCPQHDCLPMSMTCRQILTLFAQLKGGLVKPFAGATDEEAVTHEVERRLAQLAFRDTDEVDAKPVAAFSGGMRRKVSIAVAFIGDPEVVYLDEPTAGVDPVNRRLIWDMITAAKVGRSIVLTTHFMDEADILSDRIGIIHGGRMVACGTPLFLKHHFGTGYSLGLSCAQADSAAIQDTVQGVVPAATLRGDTGCDSPRAGGALRQAWFIPYGSEASFPQLLEALDVAPCCEVDLELTTLESVFLAIGEGEDAKADKADKDSQQLQVKAAHGKTREPELQPLLDSGEDAISMDSGSPTPGVVRTEELWCDIAGLKPADGVATSVQVKTLMRIMAKNFLRQRGAVASTYVLPVIYLVAGFVVNKYVKFADGGYTDFAMYDLTGSELPPANHSYTMFGFDKQSSFAFGHGVDQLDAPMFYGDQRGQLGGFSWANGTVMAGTVDAYMGSHSAISLVLHALAAYTVAADGNATEDVLSVTVAAYGGASTAFDVTSFLIPMLVGFGALGVAFVVMDVLLLQQQNTLQMLRVTGVPDWVVYPGVTLYKFLSACIPVLVVLIVLALGFGSTLMGSAGRWLATILLFTMYCFAVAPIGFCVAPLFKDVQTCQQWFPFIFLTITSWPFIIPTVIEQVAPSTAAAMGVVLDMMCILPPANLQRGVQNIMALSKDVDDPALSWGEVYGWHARVSFSIAMMLAASALEWGLLFVALKRRNRAGAREACPTAEAVAITDGGVAAERERANTTGDVGLNVRGWVKYFKNPTKAQPPCAPREPATYKQAVRGVSVGVKPDEVFVLLGPNGSGKTSLLAGCMGDFAYQPDQGTLAMNGHTLERGGSIISMFRDAATAYCPQFDALFLNMSADEHFVFYAGLRGLDIAHPQVAAHREAIVDALGLGPHRSKRASELSGGWKRKLSLAMCIFGYPKTLVLDEVTTGVDPSARHAIWEVLKPSLVRQVGRSPQASPASARHHLPAVLLSTHYMDEASTLGTRIGIMVNGSMISTGTLEELRTKHCSYNSLEIAFDRSVAEDIATRLDAVLVALEKAGMRPTVSESFFGRVKIHIPVSDMAHNLRSLASIMRTVECVKAATGIQYYTAAPMSLEQIFIQLTKQQADIDEAKAKGTYTNDEYVTFGALGAQAQS